MQICSWNILEEKVCNLETCCDIFDYYKNKEPLYNPLPDESSVEINKTTYY